MIRSAVLLLAGFALCASPAAAQEKLRYKFKAGEKHDYVLEQKTNTKTNVKGMDVESKVDMSVEMTYEVKKIDDKGNAHMQMKIGRVKMEVQGPFGIYDFDSSDPKEGKDAISKALGPTLRALAGARLDVVKSPRGETVSVDVPEEVLKKFRAAEGGAAAGLDENTFRAMSQGGVVFPEEAVEKGKNWTDMQKVDLPFGKVVSELKYTLEGQEERDGRKVQKMSFIPKMKIEASDKADFKLTVKEADGKGTVQFDNQAGVLLDQTTEMTMQMDVEIMGMTLTQSLNQATTVRLKEKK